MTETGGKKGEGREGLSSTNAELRHALNINISDNDGQLYSLDEIRDQLHWYYSQFSTFAMSDHALYLQGQRDMLMQVIAYIDAIIGTKP